MAFFARTAGESIAENGPPRKSAVLGVKNAVFDPSEGKISCFCPPRWVFLPPQKGPSARFSCPKMVTKQCQIDVRTLSEHCQSVVRARQSDVRALSECCQIAAKHLRGIIFFHFFSFFFIFFDFFSCCQFFDCCTTNIRSGKK